MLILVRFKNVLDPICNFLGKYSEMSQILLPTAEHLFLSRYRDSSLGPFSPWYSKLAVHVHNPKHLCPSH